MNTFQVASELVIDAPPDQVYAILADYHEGHQAILPRRYFKDMKVVEGGQGERTKIIVAMDVFGNKATFNLTVSEPEPGRILQEADVEAGITTVFTVDPINGGQQSKVEIRSTNPAKPGLLGRLEQMVFTAVTKRIYREELAQLSEYAQDIAPSKELPNRACT
jgi:hypothetical protein